MKGYATGNNEERTKAMNVVIDGVEYLPRVKIELMPMEFGEFLKATRKAARYSLDVASEKIGCSKSYLWELEKGRSEPSLTMAKCIGEAYGLALETLASYLPNKEHNAEITGG